MGDRHDDRAVEIIGSVESLQHLLPVELETLRENITRKLRTASAEGAAEERTACHTVIDAAIEEENSSERIGTYGRGVRVAVLQALTDVRAAIRARSERT